MPADSDTDSDMDDRPRVARRAAANAMLRAGARLAAVADALDDLRGQSLDPERRERRDWLLQEQWAARRRYEEAFARFNTP